MDKEAIFRKQPSKNERNSSNLLLLCFVLLLLKVYHDVPFNVRGLCSLGPDTLRRLQNKIVWVSATLHG